jgi:son of sevenless-like protein
VLALTFFKISVNLGLTRGQRDLVGTQERDRTEIREILQTIAKNMGDLHEILQQPAQTAVQEVMQGFQEVCLYHPHGCCSNVFTLQELHDPRLARTQEQLFKRGLLVLHEESDILPPLVDREIK